MSEVDKTNTEEKLATTEDKKENPIQTSEEVKHRIPYLYRFGLLNLKFAVFAWGVGLVLNMLTYVYHNRPIETWYAKLIPANAAFFIVILIAHMMMVYTDRAIKDLFRIDLSQKIYFDIDVRDPNKEVQKSWKVYNKFSDLELLFVDHDAFDDYQKKLHKEFINKKYDRLLLILTLILSILIVLGDRWGGYVAFYGITPNRIDNYEPVVAFSALIISILYALLIQSFLSGLRLLIIYVKSVSTISTTDGLIKADLESLNGFSLSKNSHPTLINFEHSNLAKVSLKFFKRKSQKIPQTMLPLSVLFMMVIGSIGGIFTYLLRIQGTRTLYISILIAFTVFFMLIDIYLFFYPQISIHRIIKERKFRNIDKLEERYHYKKLQWLETKEDEKEFRAQLWEEIQALSNFIEEIEEISTWPFNYFQLLTIMLTGFVALLSVSVNIIQLFNRGEII